jgi:hypothetical protein
LPLPPGKLVGQATGLLRAKSYLIEKGCHSSRSLARGDGIASDPIGDLIADAAAWVQASERILKDHLHPPTYGSQTGCTKVCDILAIESDLSFRRIEETKKKAAERALPATRFTNDTDHFPSCDFQIDPTNGKNGFASPKDPLIHREGARQPLCLDQRLH